MAEFGHYTEEQLRDEIEKLVLGVIEARERKYTPDDSLAGRAGRAGISTRATG
jgi:hypothetical protein